MNDVYDDRPRSLSQDELREIQIHGTFIPLNREGKPVPAEGGESPTGWAMADGTWIALRDGSWTSLRLGVPPATIVPCPTDPTEAWKRWMDFAKADLALTEDHFQFVKAKELGGNHRAQYRHGGSWRKSYGEEPGDVEEKLRVLAARTRECREAIAQLEAVTPASIVAERQAKTDDILRKQRYAMEREEQQREHRARINSIGIENC